MKSSSPACQGNQFDTITTGESDARYWKIEDNS